MRLRRDCFSDDWEESVSELLFFISPGRELWSGGQTRLGCKGGWRAPTGRRAAAVRGPSVSIRGQVQPNRKLVQLYTRASDH